MRKWFTVLVVVSVVFLAVNRYRLYVRDPLATLMRNSVKEEGAQIFINYANDVLIENDNTPRYIELVQHGQHAGMPQKIWCIHWTACLLDEDVATVLIPDPPVHVELINSKMVQFRDGQGEADALLH